MELQKPMLLSAEVVYPASCQSFRAPPQEDLLLCDINSRHTAQSTWPSPAPPADMVQRRDNKFIITFHVLFQVFTSAVKVNADAKVAVKATIADNAR